MGLTRVAVAFAARGQQGAGLVGLSGVAGLLIGILVLAKFPSSADWAIGLLVGIDLIFAGWTLTSALVGISPWVVTARASCAPPAEAVSRQIVDADPDVIPSLCGRAHDPLRDY